MNRVKSYINRILKQLQRLKFRVSQILCVTVNSVVLCSILIKSVDVRYSLYPIF